MELKDRNELQRKFFNEKIDTYDDVHAEFMNTKNTLGDSLPKETKKILDLGAGTGLELIHVFELFPEASITVVDISEAMLDELSKRDFANNITIKCGDFFEVDFGDNYDAVISTSALHHFTPKEKELLYKKIYDSIREGGLFINCDKISLSQEEQERMLYELEHNIENYKHIDTPLTVENEMSIMENVGFKDVTSSAVDKDNYSLLIGTK